MGITVNAQAGAIINNYDIHDNAVVNVGIGGGEARVMEEIGEEEGEERQGFEEAVPERLRTGRLAAAWEGLRKAGIVDEERRLVEGSKAEAHYVAECFNMLLREIRGGRGKMEWKPFEILWGYRDLIHGEGNFSAMQRGRIDAVFSNL